MQAADADIEVKSLQNALLEASGKVIINGAGCYHSTITAGKGVKAPLGRWGDRLQFTKAMWNSRNLGPRRSDY